MAPAPRPLHPVLGHQGTPGDTDSAHPGHQRGCSEQRSPRASLPRRGLRYEEDSKARGEWGKGVAGGCPLPFGLPGFACLGRDRQTEPPACTIGDFLRKGSVSSGTKGSYAAAQQRRGAARAHKSRGSCWGPPATSPQLPFEDAKTVPAPSRPGGTSHCGKSYRDVCKQLHVKKKKQHHKKPGRQRGI